MEDREQLERLVEAFKGLEVELYEEGSAFNAEFDAIQDPWPTVGGQTFSPSKVLFLLDRTAYNEAKREFENSILADEYEEALTELRRNNQVQIFQEVADAIQRQRLVPFVGAGISQPMGMPLWKKALRDIYDELTDFDSSEFLQAIADNNLLLAAQYLADYSPIITNNFIRKTYTIRILRGAVRHLPNIGKGCVVTTNFDNALEEVYRSFTPSMAFNGHMYGNVDSTFFQKLVRGDRCLLKLHGDAGDASTYVFTLAQYRTGYGEPFDFSRPLPKALRQIYVSNTLLFIGCGLDNDWTLELFREVANTPNYNVPDHYAILPMPATPLERTRKETKLIECHIQPIWYPDGQHEFVEKYLLALIALAERRLTL